MQIDNSLSVNSYMQNDGSEKVSEIDEEQNYTINTGALLKSEKELIREISNSLDTKLFYNQKWYDLNTKIKKTTLYKDKTNNYSESLTFTAKENTTVLNNGVGLDVPVVTTIYIDTVLVQDGVPNGAEIIIANDAATSETGYTLMAFTDSNNQISVNITATVFPATSALISLH